MTERKKILLRLDPAVHDALARWAGDELRSTNAQIEFLLRRALAEVGRLPGNARRIPRRGRPARDRPPEPEPPEPETETPETAETAGTAETAETEPPETEPTDSPELTEPSGSFDSSHDTEPPDQTEPRGKRGPDGHRQSAGPPLSPDL